MVKPTFGTFVKGASSLAQFWRKTLLLVDNWHQVKIQLFLKIIHMHVPSFYKKENILSFIILKYPTTLIYSKPDEQIFWKLLMYFSFNTIRYLHIYFIFSHVLKPDELETNLVFFQTSISLRNSSVIRVLVIFLKGLQKIFFWELVTNIVIDFKFTRIHLVWSWVLLLLWSRHGEVALILLTIHFAHKESLTSSLNSLTNLEIWKRKLT